MSLEDQDQAVHSVGHDHDLGPKCQLTTKFAASRQSLILVC